MPCDPNTLLEQAKCILGCFPPGAAQPVEIFLLCRIAVNNSVVTPGIVGGGSLSHWWLAEDLGALGLVNNSKVGAAGLEWTDKTSGVKLFQNTVAAQPRYMTNVINGKPVVQFQSQFGPDGAPQNFELNPASFTMNGDFTTVAILQTQIVPTSGEAFDHLRGTTGAGLGTRFTTPGTNYNAYTRINGGANQHFTAWNFTPTTAHSVFHRRIGSAQSAFLDAGQRQDLTLSGNMTIDRFGNVTANFSHDIRFNVAELIHYTSGLSDTEVTTLYNSYLKPRYALP